MKLETILNAFDLASYWLDKSSHRNERYQRQRNAFRARILRVCTELEMIEAGYHGLQYEMNKQLAEKDARIAELEAEVEQWKEFAKNKEKLLK